jgi:hypothetical protein
MNVIRYRSAANQGTGRRAVSAYGPRTIHPAPAPDLRGERVHLPIADLRPASAATTAPEGAATSLTALVTTCKCGAKPPGCSRTIPTPMRR